MLLGNSPPTTEMLSSLKKMKEVLSGKLASQVDRIKVALSGKLTKEELCSLPVETVCYPLGIWLGLEEKELTELHKICAIEPNRFKHEMFISFLTRPFHRKNSSYLELIKSLPHDRKSVVETLEKYSSENVTLQEMGEIECMLNTLDEGPAINAATSIFFQKQQLREKVVNALVKMGLREEAQYICKAKGKIILTANDSSVIYCTFIPCSCAFD